MPKPTTNDHLPSTLKQLKVALVHDWLIGGGAEKVVYQLHQLFPDAPVYTSYATPEWQAKLDGKVVTGFLQHGPFPRLRKFIPFLRIWWFSRLDLEDYDLVISSSGAEAKGIRVGKHRRKPNKILSLLHTNYEIPTTHETLHVNYCHAPTHYYWSRYNEYMHNPGFGAFNWLARLGLKLLVAPLRHWDYKAARRPDHMIANSTHIQAEIKKYYGRDSVVVFPPVDVERFSARVERPRQGFVTSGRQTPYKRIDLAVAACTQLNLPLTVISTGPEHEKLKSIAGPSIKFVGNVSDQEVSKLFRTSEAFIFPGLDDFGITPVEALAAGTPVIAYHGGGALDYVIPGKTGAFFAEQTVDSLAQALQQFKPEDYSPADLKSFAKSFSNQSFRESFLAELQKL